MSNFKTITKQLFFILLFLIFPKDIHAQNLYKTPSGQKYHLATCHMVKNVSKKVSPEQINALGLTPCKICHPPDLSRIKTSYRTSKAVGQTSKSVQCKGRTKQGTRCKHKTRIANGYCFQHQNQVKN